MPARSTLQNSTVVFTSRILTKSIETIVLYPNYTAEVNGYTGPQLNADRLLDHIATKAEEASGDGTIHTVGLVWCDLFSKYADWNFLWGWADIHRQKHAGSFRGQGGSDNRDHIGLLSMARSGQRSADDVWSGIQGLAHLMKHLIRSIAVWLFGMKQCTLAKCLFNGSGCDDEMRGTPCVPCIVCTRKLCPTRAIESAEQLYSLLSSFF